MNEASVRAAVERVVEDLRQRSIWLSDDTAPTVMSWFQAHRRHKADPYIACPFCHDKFVPKDAVVEAASVIERLAEQQAMPDDWYQEPLARLRDLASDVSCGVTDRPYGEWQFRELVDEATRLRRAAIRLVAALDHSAQGGGRALDELREVLSATTAI